MSTIINLQSVSKSYPVGQKDERREIQVLKPLDLAIKKGGYIALTGPSGSGKSTLLNLMAGIDRPTGGLVTVDGVNFGGLGESKLAKLRGAKIGVVFQFFQLIPTLTALENIVLAMDLVGVIEGKRHRARAQSLLDQMGVGTHANKLPSRLSGGEQQRVAIARALANDPPILVADEPTGNLDAENSRIVANLLGQCVADGRTVVVATHEYDGLERYGRVLRLVDGVLQAEGTSHD